jgi:predicted nucleotidyltransferase component of viral defense system
MIKRILEEKLKDYTILNVIDQENVLQELVQQYILASLSRTNFFSEGIFHGGTCLRILFGMNRFSEDLDFFLKKADHSFSWEKYLERISKDGEMEGILFGVQDKSRSDCTVKKAILGTTSIGKELILELPFERDQRKKIKVKLEIDTNPPVGSNYETRYLTFPLTTAITTQTLESGFAMKIGALLSRGYVKGRDWYDFIWYISRKTRPDFALLQNALEQNGPWAGQKIRVGADWILDKLKTRINKIDWEPVQEEIQRFVPLSEQEALTLWGQKYFLFHLDALAQYIT